MPRPLFQIALLILGILLGFHAARWLAERGATQPPPPPPPAAPQNPDEEPDATWEPPSAEPREAGQKTEPEENAPAQPSPLASTPHAEPSPPSEARTEPNTAGEEPVSIPRKFFRRIQCPAFNTSSNCITDEISELLQITPEEREKIDRLIRETRNRIEADEIERAMVTEQTAARVVLQIAANPEPGRIAETAFETAIQETLGDRAGDFLERAQLYYATLFSSFGKNDTTLTVTRDESSSLLRVQSRQEYMTAGGRGTATTTTMTEKMPSRWQKFFQAP
jgi:hypothetical protein